MVDDGLLHAEIGSTLPPEQAAEAVAAARPAELLQTRPRRGPMIPSNWARGRHDLRANS
jgi:hypothetical protein